MTLHKTPHTFESCVHFQQLDFLNYEIFFQTIQLHEDIYFLLLVSSPRNLNIVIIGFLIFLFLDLVVPDIY